MAAAAVSPYLAIFKRARSVGTGLAANLLSTATIAVQEKNTDDSAKK